MEEANNELRAQVNDPNQVPLSNAALKELDTLVDKVETARDEIESIQISDDSRPKEVQERVKDLLSDLEFMQDETKSAFIARERAVLCQDHAKFRLSNLHRFFVIMTVRLVSRSENGANATSCTRKANEEG